MIDVLLERGDGLRLLVLVELAGDHTQAILSGANIGNFAKMILNGLQFGDEFVDACAEHIAEDSHGVTQALELDAQSVKRCSVGLGDGIVVGAHGSEMLVEQFRQQVAHLVGMDVVGIDRERAFARFGQEGAEILDEVAIGAFVEQMNELLARFAALLVHLIEGGLKIGLTSFVQLLLIGLQFGDHHVEVAHTAKRIGDFAHVLQMGSDHFGFVIGSQQAQGAAHPADAHAHIVDFFRVFTRAAARFMREHFDEVDQQGFAPGFRHQILSVDGLDVGLQTFGERFRTARWAALRTVVVLVNS